MNGKGLFSDSEPNGIRTCDWHADVKWYDASDVLDNPFDQEDDGYGADSEDTDDDDTDFDVSITTFPYPWLSKLVVTHNQKPAAIIHKKPVEMTMMYRGRPVALFYRRFSSILEEMTNDLTFTTTPKKEARQPLLLSVTPHTPSAHTAAEYSMPTTTAEHSGLIKIDDTHDSNNSDWYSPPEPLEQISQVVPFEYHNNGYYSYATPDTPCPASPYVTCSSDFGSLEECSRVFPLEHRVDKYCDTPGEPSPTLPCVIDSSDDDYPESVISLSSGDDSVICLSSDDDASDCDSVISLSSTESDSVIFVGASTLKRPREEPKKSKPQERGPKRIRYDPALEESTLQAYVSPGNSQRTYYAVKYSRHPGVFTDFNVALNHSTRPEDVHRFDDLQDAAYFLESRPKFFEATQRQHLNIRGRPVFEVFSDGSSKVDSDGKQWGGFGVWFGHYHPDNVAGPLTGDLQDPLQGELRGLLEAYKVLYNRHDDLLYTIYCDCYAVVQKLNAGKSFPRKYHTIATSIQLYKQLLGMKVMLRHIVGHCGHPGNERADILAKMGRVRRDGRISCMNAVMEDRYRRTIGEDSAYPFNGVKLDYLLDRRDWPQKMGAQKRRA